MNVDEFLGFLFSGVNADDPDEAVVVCGDGARSQRSKAKKNKDWRARRWVPGQIDDKPGRMYFGISTVVPRRNDDGSLGFKEHDLKLTYAIALDDIGVKTSWERAAQLPAPNIKLKTSNVPGDPRGSQQWFYALAQGADPARAAALVDGLADAGLTDAGADRANRWMRIPGSINLKNGEVFGAEVIDEGCVDTCMSLAQLEVAFARLGVAAHAPRNAVQPIEPLEDEMADPVFRWLLASPLSPLKRPTVKANNGWWAVNCPWEHEHESGQGGGADYLPGTGFKCQHETCKHNGRNVRAFRLWCLEQDPEAGFTADRDPLETIDVVAFGQELAAVLDATIGVAPEEGVESVRFQPSPDQAMRDEMIENYIHVEVQNQYWSVRSKGLVERAAIDDRMTAAMKRTSLLHVYNDKGTRLKDMAVSVWLRGQSALRRVANLTHRLGQPLIVDDCINIAPGLPVRLDVPGDPDLWFDLVDYVCGAQAELVLDWMAMVVTAFDEKPGWHVILKGPAHGTGKALMFSPLARYLTPYKLWFGLKPVDISKQFTPFLERRLLILDELKRTTRGEITLSDIYNTIKAWTARGTGMVMIEKKNQQPYEACDLSCWVIFSNQDVPLPIEEGDRRFLVGNVPEPREEAYYKPIIKWLDQGGWQVVISYLHERWDSMSEADREMLRGRAPMSEAKADLIESSAEGIDGAVRAHIRGIRCEPWPDLMTMTDITSALRASEQLTEYYKSRLMSDQTVGRALRNVGAVQMFKGKQVEDEGRRMRLWCMRSARLKAYEKLGMGKAIFEAYRSMRTSSGANEAFNVVKFPPQR